MTTDLDGIVTSWSVGSTSIFGFSSDEMVGRNNDVLFTPEDNAGKIPEREREVAAQQGRAADFRWHMRNGGTRFWADGVLTPIRDDRDELIGFLKILRDITDQK
jgi:PAS domain S-box-containing protein